MAVQKYTTTKTSSRQDRLQLKVPAARNENLLYLRAVYEFQSIVTIAISCQRRMPELEISRVVAVSSEDPQFPATNLLTGGEWRCLGTEEEAWVLLQLAEPSFISDFGFWVVNEQMVAAVEVKV